MNEDLVRLCAGCGTGRFYEIALRVVLGFSTI